MKIPDIRAVRLHDDGTFPNSALPLLLYTQALEPTGALATAFEARFAGHGWGRSWRNGIYGFRHFHSTAHEVLGIAAGAARIELGGPDGTGVDVVAGDAVLIPAGVCHCNLGASDDFLVIGSYPDDAADVDLRRESRADRSAALERLPHVRRPDTDPVLGANGGLVAFWR